MHSSLSIIEFAMNHLLALSAAGHTSDLLPRQLPIKHPHNPQRIRLP